MKNVCPICLDKGKKVSAVYDAGNTYGGQSELTKSLAPPPKPQPKGSGGGLLFIVWLVATLLVCRLEFGQGEIVAIITGIGIYFLVLFVLVRVYQQNEKKSQEEYKPVLLAWQNKRNKWAELYYCENDDCVFDPTTLPVKSVPRLSMNTLLE